MNKKIKIIILILSILTLTSLIYFTYDRINLPVTYNVCDINYSNCSIVAKFDDMDSCERHNEKAGWYCDTLTNSQNITCEVKRSAFVTSYCSK